MCCAAEPSVRRWRAARPRSSADGGEARPTAAPCSPTAGSGRPPATGGDDFPALGAEAPAAEVLPTAAPGTRHGASNCSSLGNGSPTGPTTASTSSDHQLDGIVHQPRRRSAHAKAGSSSFPSRRCGQARSSRRVTVPPSDGASSCLTRTVGASCLPGQICRRVIRRLATQRSRS